MSVDVYDFTVFEELLIILIETTDVTNGWSIKRNDEINRSTRITKLNVFWIYLVSLFSWDNNDVESFVLNEIVNLIYRTLCVRKRDN